jgi:TIR domain
MQAIHTRLSGMYQYDVFVSYSRSDQAWARRIVDDLRAQKLKVFFDQDRLEAGAPWNDQLREALKFSRSLVLVWTDSHAKTSDWVSKERAAFWLLPDLGGSRRLISVNLQGRPEADARLQGIDDLLSAGVDSTDADSAGPALWSAVVRRVCLGLSDAVVTMPVLALTMTRPEAEALPAKEWTGIESELGVSLQQAATMYGQQRTDWRPIGGADNLGGILNRLEARINAQMPNPETRYIWEFPREEFWSDAAVAEAFAARMANPLAPALLIIDPIALRQRDIIDRLGLFQDTIAGGHAAILVLAPFSMPDANQRLRRWLLANARSYFSPLFQPKIPPRAALEAQCALFSGDEDELVRVTSIAVGRGYRAAGSSPKSGPPAYLVT